MTEKIDSPEVVLARRLVQGDQAAMQQFVELFQRKVFQYTWLMCGHREDAEEVAQDTLLKVFENWEQLRDPENIKPWVFRIARNCCMLKRRKSAFAPAEELPIHDVPVESAAVGPDEILLRKEIHAELERALRAIPESYRAVILLRDLEEMSTAETASLLEITEDNVKQRLHRGRAMLRKALAA